MSALEILLLALSLSLDAVVVSVGAGVLNRINIRKALVIAFFFGAFHAVMPLLGWAAGYWFRGYLTEYGHIVGFVLILLVALKMLRDALRQEDTAREKDILHMRVLLVLAFAMSIDALVIGITFNFLPVSVLPTSAIIGLVTFLMSLAGVYVGRRSRHLVGTKIELLGALVLVLLAFKVLLF
ncbi:MAG: hypothetical protein QOE22_496 [Candidatus Parcubacteria bacterium]|jgi:putative Mn2+ efflux pump MntP|nr:hypothetical protein [Candidatus Parcubacteria bacterium]